MRVAVVSFKHCWQDESGRWCTYGGFPLQMAAIASLFDEMTIAIVRVPPRRGGMPLPEHADVIVLPEPAGAGLTRKAALLIGLPRFVRPMLRAMRAADVVHTPVPGDLPFVAMIVAACAGKRLLIRYGSSWATTAETTLMNRVTKWTMRRLARRGHVVFATGAAEGGPAAGVHWLFATALAQDEIERVQPDVERAPGEPLRVAYVGRLSDEKGLHVLVDALGRLKRRSPSSADRLRVRLVGDGPLRETLGAAVRTAGCEDLVAFVGQLDRPSLIRELLATDVCVLPSLTESFCKARLDAMLCGVPVLTTDVGFGREIVGADGTRGWVVAPGDAAGLSAALERLGTVRHEEWPAIRRRCRAYVERRTLEAWTDAIAARCAAEWRLRRIEGRLRGPQAESDPIGAVAGR